MKLTVSLLLLSLVAGCSLYTKRERPAMNPETTKEVVIHTVAKADWLITAGIVGVAISAFAALNGSKAAYAAGIACLVAISMTLTTQRYAFWIAGGGLAIAGFAAIYTVFVKNRALVEIVKGIQQLPEDIRGQVKAAQDQTPATRALVRTIKGK